MNHVHTYECDLCGELETDENVYYIRPTVVFSDEDGDVIRLVVCRFCGIRIANYLKKMERRPV